MKNINKISRTGKIDSDEGFISDSEDLKTRLRNLIKKKTLNKVQPNI